MTPLMEEHREAIQTVHGEYGVAGFVLANDSLSLSTSGEPLFIAALSANDSAVEVLGDRQPRVIAGEVVATVRNNVSIDWTVRETARANLCRLVRRVLRRHGYPPDQQEDATDLVIEQAELISGEWAA